jgi:hypothetical protein
MTTLLASLLIVISNIDRFVHGDGATEKIPEPRTFGFGRILLVKEGVVMSLRSGMLDTLACLARK